MSALPGEVRERYQDPLEHLRESAVELWDMGETNPDAFRIRGIEITTGATDDSGVESWICFAREGSRTSSDAPMYNRVTLRRPIGFDVSGIRVERQRPTYEDEGFGSVVRTECEARLDIAPPTVSMVETVGRVMANGDLEPSRSSRRGQRNPNDDDCQYLEDALTALKREAEPSRWNRFRSMLGSLGLNRSQG